MSDTALSRRAGGSGRRGCLVWIVAVAALAVVLFFAIGLYFDEGDDASQPARGFDAGPASAYEIASISYFEAQHFFITRLQDGTFIALYDKSTKQQELGGGCRVAYQEGATLGTASQLPGMTGALAEECEQARTVWRVDGTFAFGSGYGDLDRFDTRIDAAGRLIVETASRSCTRSRGVIGVAPFDAERCGNAD